MKKMIAMMVLAMALPVMAADVVITITIPEAKLAKVAEGFLEIYPNTETWDDDADPETPEVAKYTDKQWFKEKILRNMKRDVQRGLKMKANREAVVAEDPDIAN